MIKMKITKSRKGQFYLFTSLILIIMLAAIIPKSAPVYEKEDVFLELKDNFIAEMPHVVDNALYHNTSVLQSVEMFSANFLNYARQRDHNFGFVIMLRNRNETILMNRLKENVSLKPYGDPVIELSPGQASAVEPYQSFMLHITDGSYLFSFSEKPQIQLKMLFKSYENDNIYIKELY